MRQRARASSSRRPRLPGGLVSRSRRRCAATSVFRVRWADAINAPDGAARCRAARSAVAAGAALMGTAIPATIKVTRSAAAATRWLTCPRRSRKRRPSAVGGCTPSPTSLEIRTMAARRSLMTPAISSPPARMAWSECPPSIRLATQRVRQSTITRSALTPARRQAVGRSMGSSSVDQSGGALRAVPRDAGGEVGVARLGGGDERDAAAPGPTELEGVAALSAARAAQDEMGQRWRESTRSIRHDHPDPPAKTGMRLPEVGSVSWLSDRPTPHAFPAAAPPASGSPWVSSPNTVTGSRRIRTAFPVGPSRGAPRTP